MDILYQFYKDSHQTLFSISIVTCSRNQDCPVSETCIDSTCQRPCDIRNPCVEHAVCINTNHGSDCSCIEGFQGNGYVNCQPGNE